MNTSVVQNWLQENCNWKQQTVLLASFRGCDGVDKHDPSKIFTKNMRNTLLNNADTKSTFMVDFGLKNTDYIDNFFIDCSVGSLDQYPVHWLMHLLQAAEIVAYKCPNKEFAEYWKYFYLTGVNALHLNPETEDQLDQRLKDNRTIKRVMR